MTVQEKATFAAKQVLRSLKAAATNTEPLDKKLQAIEDGEDDWYDMFYELFTDELDINDYKDI